MQAENVRVYLSTAHPCPYLPGRTASSLIIDPDLNVDGRRLTQLTMNGFRRSGDLVYRPHCPSCCACVSVRIPAAEFQPSRGQRRIWHKNTDVSVNPVAATFEQRHFDLYLRYQNSRHPDSDMCDQNPEKYHQFLIANNCNTKFQEFRVGEQLVAVSVADELLDGLSAVYTFFDPDQSKRSLGTFAILWQIEQVKQQGLKWLYLGYWISQCDKMSYKTQYKPIQGFQNGAWHCLL